MKILTTARAENRANHKPFSNCLRTAFRLERPAGGVERLVVLITGSRSPFDSGKELSDPFRDTIFHLWTETAVPPGSPACFGPSMGATLTPVVEARTCNDVNERHLARRTPGSATLPFRKPIPGKAPAETRLHRIVQAPLTLAIHQGTNRYVQNTVLPRPIFSAAWLGIAHLHYPAFEHITDDLHRTAPDVSALAAETVEFVSETQIAFAVECVTTWGRR